MNILCNEIKEKIELTQKFGIVNDNQCELLLDLIQQNENVMQIEGFS